MKLALGVVLALTLPATARADQCDALGIDVSQATNAKIERRANRNVLEISHPWADKAGVDFCNTDKPGLSASVETAYPKTTFFDFIGVAGSAILKSPPETLRANALKCARAALADRDGIVHRAAAGLNFTCNAKAGPDGFMVVLVDRRG